MKRADFTRLVEATLATLPALYADRLHNLVFLVEDWADADTLAEVGFDAAEELLGFFTGTPLTERSFDQIDQGPEMIILYQGAIEEEARRSGLPVRQVVRETLWHEIAHYFGFSEAEMDRIEDFWAGEG
jgi:predicted Zn-dependent protease with MMP-like domain